MNKNKNKRLHLCTLLFTVYMQMRYEKILYLICMFNLDKNPKTVPMFVLAYMYYLKNLLLRHVKTQTGEYYFYI